MKKILLGITGGIAAYKSASLIRLLTKSGIDVQVVMTNAATRFISKITMQALSGKPVAENMWQGEGHGMSHIELSRGKNLILIAPASANFIAKLAHGAADDLLSTICLARNCRVVVAPAMNREMWENKATQRNIRTLESDGITFVGPEGGDQACGEIGLGRMSEPAIIFDSVVSLLSTKSFFSNVNILVTVGGTFEKIDAVRGITNQSSGEMGFSVARAAIECGASVTIVAGITTADPPNNCRIIKVESAEEMYSAVTDVIAETDIFISVAAVADYKVKSPRSYKLKKNSNPITEISLEPTRDILKEIGALTKPPLCVGFAAETENLEINAQKKRLHKNIPLIVGNLVQDSIGLKHSELLLIDSKGSRKLPKDTKLNQARKLMQHIGGIFEEHKN